VLDCHGFLVDRARISNAGSIQRLRGDGGEEDVPLDAVDGINGRGGLVMRATAPAEGLTRVHADTRRPGPSTRTSTSTARFATLAILTKRSSNPRAAACDNAGYVRDTRRD